eukprot:TRINITY_DN1125_c0_g1_i2.p1 TRINITY_DN1125_c0_g1~~TRINITY_DN1125_c0_g1_i2.p1  ORF type:complete len:974 (+),score=208.43 TRINITY_DN1125_c0_g1_i2:59-2980(+)
MTDPAAAGWVLLESLPLYIHWENKSTQSERMELTIHEESVKYPFVESPNTRSGHAIFGIKLENADTGTQMIAGPSRGDTLTVEFLEDLWNEVAYHEKYKYLCAKGDSATASERQWILEQERNEVFSPICARFIFPMQVQNRLYGIGGGGLSCEIYFKPRELVRFTKLRRSTAALPLLYAHFYPEQHVLVNRRAYAERDCWETSCIPQLWTSRSLLLKAIHQRIPEFGISDCRGLLVDSLECMDALQLPEAEEQRMLEEYMQSEDQDEEESHMMVEGEGDESRGQTSGITSEDAGEEDALTDEEAAAPDEGVAAEEADGRTLSRAESSMYRTWRPQAQPRTLMGKRLFEYQLRALAWMRSVEQHASAGYRFGVHLSDEAATKRFRDLCVDQSVVRGVLRSRGGVLADEMGLGKSLVVIALILAHARERLAESTVDLEYPRTRAGLAGGGTLILCPSHLVQQWKAEIEDNTSLQTLFITTSNQWSKTTYAKLLAADCVVVSHSFLQNSSFRAALPPLKDIHRVDKVESEGSGRSTSSRRSTRSTRSSRAAAAESSSSDSLDFTVSLNSVCPVLQKIDWQRIVLDEGHEVLGTDPSRKFEIMMGSFCSRHRWFVSGTPLPHYNSLHEIMNFLQCTSFARAPIGRDRHGRALCEVLQSATFKRSLYWRNTKETAKTADKIPAVVEDVIWVRHSDVEAAMYNAAAVTNDRTRMRQICCHPLISARDREVLGDQVQTLDEIRERLVRHNRQKVNAIERSRTEAAEKLERYELRMHGNTVRRQNRMIELLEENDEDSRVVRDFKDRSDQEERAETRERAHRARTLDKCNQELADEKQRGQFFQALVPKATEALKEPCLICFDDIEVASVTKCGHVFCAQCIRTAVQLHHNCPICRTALGNKDIAIVKNNAAGDVLVVDTLAIRHGGKMARLIVYLRQVLSEDPDNKVIVFSQWDAMLHRIGDTLKEEVLIWPCATTKILS